MAEIFDRLLIRILLTAFVCLIILLYRYLHLLFFPTVKNQVLKRFDPSDNPVDTLHYFSRIVGIAIVFSSLAFNEGSGLLVSLFHFLIWSLLAGSLYLLSLFIIDSILLYNFDYETEVQKRKNMNYGIISLAHSLGLAFLTRSIITQSDNSLIILLILWLIVQVLQGISVKYFHLISKMNFNKMMLQKQLGISFSYLGFYLGMTYFISQSLNQEQFDLTNYSIQILLKVILGLIIYPLFKGAIGYIFLIKFYLSSFSSQTDESSSLGHGILEGCLFVISAILSSLIVNNIEFGTIYPFF